MKSSSNSAKVATFVARVIRAARAAAKRIKRGGRPSSEVNSKQQQQQEKPALQRSGQRSREVNSTQKPEKPEKQPLQRDIPPAAPFPVEALGDILGGATLALHEAIQAPIATCGNSVLAAAHLAVQAHADVEIDGRVHPLSEIFITVSESGGRKSTVDGVVLQTHRAYEKRLQDSFNRCYADYNAESEAFQGTRGEAHSSSKRTTSAQPVNADLDAGAEAFPPLSPIILCEEPTFAALLKNLAAGHPSQGLFSDEAGRFLSGHAMSTENALSTLAGLSKLWDGKAIDRIRVEDGATKLYGKRLSCHLMGQPDVMARLIADPTAQDQGFLSRCLIVVPESTIGHRPYRAINLADSPPMRRYAARMEELLELEPVVEDRDDIVGRSQLKPRRLSLTSAAKANYVEFHDTVERAMAGPLKELRGYANKAPEHAARIAGMLALVQNPNATEIGPSHMASARLLMEYYLQESHRMNEMARQNPSLTLAQRLLEWMQGLDRPVSLVEIYQRGPNSLRNAQRARDIVGILLEHGHIEPAQRVVYDGRRRSEGWQLTR